MSHLSSGSLRYDSGNVAGLAGLRAGWPPPAVSRVLPQRERPRLTALDPAHRWSLRDVSAKHGIRQKLVEPHCPWQNADVEWLIRTLHPEWAYRKAFTSKRRTRPERLHPAPSATTHPTPTSRLPPTQRPAT